MAKKFIFIGVGGSGTNTVAQVKYKVYERTHATALKTRLQVMDETYRFLFVDTDNSDINSINKHYRSMFENGRVSMISSRDDLIDLGTENPSQIYNSAAEYPQLKLNKRVVEACGNIGAGLFDNRVLRNGAEAIRLNSRLALGFKNNEFCTKLHSAIQKLNVADENGGEANEMNYYIVCSSVGGTGSGCVNDILYYVNMVHKSVLNVGEPKVVLTLFMPQHFIDINLGNSKYPSNGYAVLRELEGFKVLYENNRNGENGGMLFHRLALTGEDTIINQSYPYNPFDSVIPVDFQTETETNMGDNMSMYSNTAEMLFYIHDGEAANRYWANRNNKYDPAIPHCFLTPIGYVALRKPEKDFEDYLKIRLKYEFLKYGIIGSPVSKEEERRQCMQTLFSESVKKYLFSGDSAESYINILKGSAETIIEDSFSSNIILDENSKPLQNLPDNVSEAEAETVISEIKAAIDKIKTNRRQFIKAVEDALLSWIEANGRRHGLEYVKSILRELDSYCTSLYDLYIDVNSCGEDLVSLKLKRRSSLVEIKDSTHASLDDLYQKAIQITFKERINRRNSDDVTAYFDTLKAWVEETAEYLVSEEVFSLLKEISYGDHALTDKLIGRVQNLLSAANEKLTNEHGAYQDYLNLAKAFLRKKEDITSVYLPDITGFSDAYGWVQGNKFDEWYGKVITPSEVYIRGDGFVPVRNGETAGLSLEGLFAEMLRICGEDMLNAGYISNDKNHDSHLFTNGTIDNYTRVIEDLLDYSVVTIESKANENKDLQNEWYGKSLANFHVQLNQEARESISRRMSPSLFFSPVQNMNSNNTIEEKYFCGPTADFVQSVFGQNPTDITANFVPIQTQSLVYAFKVKFKMSFEHYRTFKAMKHAYESSPDRARFHFHQAVSAHDGHYENVRLPKEYSSSMKTFIRYILLDEFKGKLASIRYTPSEAYEASNYKESPFFLDGTVMRVAKNGSVKSFDGKVGLQYSTDGIDNFELIEVSDPTKKYSTVFTAFEKNYQVDGFDYFVSEYLRQINLADHEILLKNYNDIWTSLKTKLNTLWSSSTNPVEKSFIYDILTVLNKDLDTYNKFIDCRK